MIQIDNLSFQYQDDKNMALKDISLTIAKGDFIGIIGESGAGKSTLGYAINGIIPHHYKGDYYGRVTVAGLDTFEEEPSSLALHVGSVFQDIDSQMVATEVEDEIIFGLENFGVPKEEIEGRIELALKEIGISHLRHREINSLSGGQKQKVAIAAIVALSPKILLLDEPTGELDPKSSRQIFQMLQRLNKEHNMTIIIIEQKIMLLCEYAKKLIVMKQGQMLCQGDVLEVLKQSDKLEEAGINIPRVSTLCRKLKDLGLTKEEMCIHVDETEAMIRQDILSAGWSEPQGLVNGSVKNTAKVITDNTSENISDVMAAFRNVSFGYNSEMVVKDVSFTIQKGEFVALIGENGAGKSTLSKLFNGLHKPGSGTVLIDNMNTKEVKSSIMAKSVGFLFQNPDRQICQNTIAEEIAFGLRCTTKDETEIERRTSRIIDFFGFDRDAAPFSQSRGERQRIALASLIAVEPRLLILDEPTTGLDYRECMEMMEQIETLNKKGVTVIMICHDMEVVLDFAKRVIVLSEGRIVADGETRVIFRNREALQKASILPPQITELSQRLGDAFMYADTVDEMVQVLTAGKEGAR